MVFVRNFLEDNTDQWFRKAWTNCSSLVIAAIPEDDAFLSTPFRKDWFETNLKDVDIVDVLVWVLFLIVCVDVRRCVDLNVFQVGTSGRVMAEACPEVIVFSMPKPRSGIFRQEIRCGTA